MVDVLERVLDKMDEIRKDITEIKIELTKIRSDFDNHIENNGGKNSPAGGLDMKRLKTVGIIVGTAIAAIISALVAV